MEAVSNVIATYSDIEPVVEAITAQFNLGTVVAVVAAAAAVSIGGVFGWWGARKAKSMIWAAFSKGKLRL